jgi:hypothetical protein
MRFTKYLEAAVCFYIGAFLILLLHYVSWVLEARTGYKIGPEVGIDIETLFHFVAFLPYLGAFMVIEYELSRFNGQVLERRYLVPISLSIGVIVSYTFLYDLDFLFWLVYEKGTGTILLSVIAVELLVLLIHAVIVGRLSRS